MLNTKSQEYSHLASCERIKDILGFLMIFFSVKGEARLSGMNKRSEDNGYPAERLDTIFLE